MSGNSLTPLQAHKTQMRQQSSTGTVPTVSVETKEYSIITTGPRMPTHRKTPYLSMPRLLRSIPDPPHHLGCHMLRQNSDRTSALQVYVDGPLGAFVLEGLRG